MKRLAMVVAMTCLWAMPATAQAPVAGTVQAAAPTTVAAPELTEVERLRVEAALLQKRVLELEARLTEALVQLRSPLVEKGITDSVASVEQAHPGYTVELASGGGVRLVKKPAPEQK